MEQRPHDNQDHETTPELVPPAQAGDSKSASNAHAVIHDSANGSFAPLERFKTPPTSFHPLNPSWQSWGHPLPRNDQSQR